MWLSAVKLAAAACRHCRRTPAQARQQPPAIREPADRIDAGVNAPIDIRPQCFCICNSDRVASNSSLMRDLMSVAITRFIRTAEW